MVNKKAQEEMIGFVLIAVILAVIFVILISISLNNSDNKSTTTSNRALYTLETLQDFTTNCSISFESNRARIGSLVEKCHEGMACTSGVDACDALKDTLDALLKTTHSLSGSTDEAFYEFTATYEPDSQPAETIVSIIGVPSSGSAVCQNEQRTARKPLGDDYWLEFSICMKS